MVYLCFEVLFFNIVPFISMAVFLLWFPKKNAKSYNFWHISPSYTHKQITHKNFTNLISRSAGLYFSGSLRSELSSLLLYLVVESASRRLDVTRLSSSDESLLQHNYTITLFPIILELTKQKFVQTYLAISVVFFQLGQNPFFCTVMEATWIHFVQHSVNIWKNKNFFSPSKTIYYNYF